MTARETFTAEYGAEPIDRVSANVKWKYKFAYYSSGWDAGAADTVKMYEPILQDHDRLVRELDECINGVLAAPSPSLCDIVSQVRRRGLATDPLMSALYLYLGSNLADPEVLEQCNHVALDVLNQTQNAEKYSLVQATVERTLELTNYVKFLEAQRNESLRFIMEQKTTIAELKARLEESE